MMYLYISKPFRAILAAITMTFFCSVNALAQLSGSYTVDPSGSATSSNYLTISDACTDLSYGYRSDGGPANGPGTSSSVTVSIADGSYNENPFLQYVSSNPVTFQSSSGDSSKVIIVGSTGWNYYGGVFTLDACSYVTLSKIGIYIGPGSYYGSGVALQDGSNYNNVNNCWILGQGFTYTNSWYWGAGIVNMFWSAYSNNDNNSYANNRISNCWDGVHTEGYYYWSYTNQDGTIAKGNIIDSFYNYAFYCYDETNGVYSNNLAKNCANSNGYGVYSYDNNGPMSYTANTFDLHTNGYAGIYTDYNHGYSGGGEITIANNFISILGSSTYQGNGIYMGYGDDYNLIEYNSINVVGNGNTSAALFDDYDYTFSSTIENNNLVNAGGGYAYWIYGSGSNSIGTADYNNVYTTGSYVGSMDYSNQAALSDWQSYTGSNAGFTWDVNSVSTDPIYNNVADLHASSAAIDGKATPISAITTDIDGQTRNTTTPDIGADEFTPVNDDASISTITNPSGNYCPGTQTVIATLRNPGVHTLTSCYITYKVNGSTVGTYTWSGSLATGSSTSVSVGTYSFASGIYGVSVESSMPNGVTDLNPSNDVASISGLNPGMSGTKTISLSGTPDYTTFGAAITDLKTGGLCGAVIFKVADGVYNENPQLNVPVVNASATNTITFQSASGDSSKCIVNAQFTGNYYSGLFDLTNTNWVTLSNLTIEGTNTSGQYGNGIWLTGASHCTITNCVIRGNGVTATIQNNYAYGIGLDVYNGNGYVNAHFNSINNCNVEQFYYGVYHEGYNWNNGNQNYDNAFTNNKIDSNFYMGIYNDYGHHILIDNNTIDNIYYPYGYAYGVYVNNSDSLHITGNKINLDVICYNGALTLYYNTNSSSYHGLVANNFIRSTGYNSYQGDGIYMYGNQYTDVVYNSVNVTSGSASYALYDGDNSYNYNLLENNNLVHSGGGYACYAYSNYFSSGYDYNNFYTSAASGTNFIYWDGSTFSNSTAGFSSFTSSYGSHSVSADPLYYTASNLHALSGAIYGKGTPYSGVTTDIDGDTRSSSTPTIGADEFTPVNDDAGVSQVTNPSGAYCSGTTTMTCVVRNYGLHNLSTVDVLYSVNGGSPVSGSFSFSSIATGASVTLTFGTYNFSGSSNDLVVYTKNPNGATDGNNANDTTSELGLKLGVNGSKTIKTSGGDYTSFNDALNTILTNGICGSVVVTADDGVWAEQISFPSNFPATASKTVTFQGNTSDSSKVVLSHPADYNYSTNYALQFDGCQYVTFKKITISRANGYGYNQSVNFQNGACNNTVQGCNIVGASGYSYNNVNDNNSSDTNNQFISTRIAGNQYATAAVYLSNSVSWSFLYCAFDSGYYNNFYANYTTDLNIRNCTFTNQQYLYPYGYYYADLQMYYCGNANSSANGIIGNYFLSTNVGILDQDNAFGGTNNYSMLIANNMFINNSNNSYYGYNVGYWGNYVIKRNIVYNSFNATTSGSNYGNLYMGDYSGYYTGYTSSVNIKNNSFCNTGGGYCIYYNQNYSSSYNANINYNNYYFTGSYLGYYNYTGNSSSLSAWKSNGYGFDANSYNGNPSYTSATNLHAYGSTLNNHATPGWVTTDYDGQTRSTTTPDIGADEFTPSPNDAGISSITSPSGAYCSGTNTITAVLGSYGTNNLSSAIITWRITGSATASGTYTWTTTTPLTFGQTVSVSVGTYSFGSGGTYNLSVASSLPNGNTDLNTSNDSSYRANMNAGLSGTKTIAATGGDYSSFNNAVNAIQTNGLCGSLVLQVANGNYNEQISLGSTFPTTASNTVTFQGNTSDSTKVVLYNAASSSYTGTPANYVVQLKGAQYVTFKNMYILRSGGSSSYSFFYYGNAVQILNGANNNKFLNCQIRAPKSSYGYYGADAITTADPYYTSGSTDTGNLVKNCRIVGGYYNVNLYGASSSSLSTGNRVEKCNIDSGYNTNINMYYQDRPQILNNTLGYTASTSANIYMYYCGNSGNDNQAFITGNYLNCSNGGTAIYDAQSVYLNSAYNSNKFLIANNMILLTGSSNINGIYEYYSKNRNVVYNTVSVTNTNTSSTAFYYYDYSYNYASPLVTVKDNIWYNAGGGLSANVYGWSTSYAPVMNYNDYYFTGSSLGYYYGTNYSSLSSWKTGSAQDANSVSADPNFTSSTDLHVHGTAVNNAGTPISGVTTDFDGQTRSTTTPDIGADEFTPPLNDAGIASFSIPGLSYCLGTSNVTVTLKNYGANNISSATIRWSVNGTAQTPYSWSGTLTPGATASVFIGAYSFTSGAYSVNAYSTNPNGTTDGDHSNDTTKLANITQGLSGTYTIGGGTPNYTTFAAALADLNTKGICGAITYQVRDGVYNEQVAIGSIPSSATNTVTFQGNTSDSSKVVLYYAAGTSYTYPFPTNNYVVQLKGSQYITFKNMYIDRTGSTSSYSTIYFGNAVQLLGNANNNSFTSCLIRAPKTNTGSYNCDAVTTADQYSYQGSNDTGNTFSNCRIVGGYYNINLIGSGSTFLSGGNKISGCTIDSGYVSNIYLTYEDHPNVSGNKLGYYNQPGSGYGNISMYYVGNTAANNTGQINANSIYCNNGGNGIYAVNSYYLGVTYNKYLTLISNNMITIGGSSSNSGSGIYIYNNSYTNVVFNSINVTNTNSNSFPVYYNDYTYTYSYAMNNVIKDNIMANTGGGQSANITGYYYYYGPALNYNNYYYTGSNLGTFYGGTYSTLTNWQTSSSQDANSKNITPLFYSSTDLHLHSCLINNQGTPITGVSKDFDGQSRNASTPDIGADEFTPAGNDAGITSFVSPILCYCPGSNNISVVMTNFGTNTLTKATVSWTVNGTAQTPYSWTGSISSGSSATVSIGTYSFSSGSYSLKIYTTSPNGATDGDNFNDSIAKTNLGVGMSGTYSLGGISPNYSSFNSAVTAVATTGLCGAVTFQVANGSYFENVQLPNLPTTSTNTVTFQGNTTDSSKVVLQYYPSANTPAEATYTVAFNGTNWVTFKNMVIARQSSYNGYYYTGGIILMEGGASNNTVKSCYVKGNSYYNYLMGVYDYNTSDSANSFIGNYHTRSEYAFYLYGSSSSNPQKGWNISGNTFDSSYYYTIYAWNHDHIKITKNKFNPTKQYNYNYYPEIQLGYLQNTAYDNAGQISGNYINTYSTAIQDYAYSWIYGGGQYNTQIANNMIVLEANPSDYAIGIQEYYGKNRQIYYNSINVLNTNTSSYGMYIYDYTNSTSYLQNIKNNILANTGGGNCIYYTPAYGTSYTANIDYNDYYFTGTNIGTFNGTNYATLTNWQSATGKDAHSITANPTFVSSTNLHVSSAALNTAATPISGITKDFDGDTRNSTTPDIGADEFNPPAVDAAIASVLNPGVGYCLGSTTVKAVLSNNGTTGLTSATINWSVNGVAQTPYSWTGSLSGGGTATLSIGSYSFTSGTYSMLVKVVSPNGTTGPDGNPTNDSIYKASMSQGMSGTYVIALTGTYDYNSFSSAVADVVARGLCGAVTFNVSNGSYFENVQIPNIATSSSNTVTFKGNISDSSKVILHNYPGSSTPLEATYTLAMNGTKWVTFKNMTISRDNSYNGYYYTGGIILMENGSSNNTFKSCYLMNSAVYPYLMSVTDNNTTDSANSFIGNSFRRGQYALYLTGSSVSSPQSGWVISNNNFDSAYYYTIYAYYQDHIKITGNTFNPNKQYNYSYYPEIYMGYMQNTVNNYAGRISGNYFNTKSSAIQDNVWGYSFGGTQYPVLIANNMIVLQPNPNDYSYGIYSYYTRNRDVVYNSVNVLNTNTNSYALYMYDYTYTSGQTINIKNNIWENQSGGYCSYYYQAYTSSYAANIDYNDYYFNASSFAQYQGSTYSSLSGLQSGSGKDAHSQNTNPSFTSSTDLHIHSSALNGAATPITGVTTDFDGDTRNSTTPDIGADEFTPPAVDASIASMVPYINYCSTTNSVQVTIANTGSTTITSATISWTVNGTAQTPKSWTGSISPGSSATVTAGTYSFSSGTYSLLVKVANPNGVGIDGNPLNDTLYNGTINKGMSGTYTIATSGSPDYSSFATAITDLNAKGLCGATTFNVSDATYTDQLTINSIYNASATNTVTFKGNNSDSSKVVIAVTAPSSSSTFSLMFNGASYVIFDKITLERTSGYSNYYWMPDVVILQGGSHHITIKRGQILGNSYYPYAGYLVNATSSSIDSANTISGNYLSTSAYGISFYGAGTSSLEGNNVIKGNIFNNIYYYPVMLQYENYSKVTGNYFGTLSNSGYYQVYRYYVTDGSWISKNNFNCSTGGYGVYDNNCTSSSTAPSYIANNMFAMGTNSNYAINENYGSYLNIYDNTVLQTSGASSSYSVYIYSGGSGYNIQGNSIVNRNGGAAVYYYNYGGSTWTINYNDYYTSGTNIGYYNGSGYTTLSSWKSSLSLDANSINANPSFVSSTDLHISSIAPCGLKNQGVSLTGITDDIDGDLRPSKPDIGADQLNGTIPGGQWVGGVSTDWLTSTNWCNGNVPAITDNVLISAGAIYYPVIGSASTTGTADSVSITSGGSVTISGGKLTIHGQMSNNGTLSMSGGELVTEFVPGSTTIPIITGTGTFSYTGGDINFAGSGNILLPVQNYWGITTSNSGIRYLTGNTTVNGNLFVESGTTLSIGSNTLTLKGDSTHSFGTLQGGVTSNLVIAGSGNKVNIPFIQNGLHNLTLNKTNGAYLSGNVTVDDSLVLRNGAFEIRANTLFLNGPISTTSGSLKGGTTSGISFGGTKARTTLPAVTNGLSVLNISRNNGIALGANLTINDTLLLNLGVFDLTTNSASVSLGNNRNIVRSDGTMNAGPTVPGAGSTINIFYTDTLTTDNELPSTVNNVIVTASGNVHLKHNLIVNGDFTVSSGNFMIGTHTLTLGGKLITTGTLQGGNTSTVLVNDFSGSAAQMDIPSGLNLSRLKINRTNGANIKGNININDTLDLTLGQLNTDHTSTLSRIDTVVLNSSGIILNESGNSFVNGRITTTRTLTNNNTANMFGNIGMDITIPTTGTNAGSTKITRSIGSNAAGRVTLNHNGNQPTYVNISRIYKITPTHNGGLKAAIVMHYLDNELNGVPESGLNIFRKSELSTANVFYYRAVDARNSTANTLGIGSSHTVDSFSSWTAGGFPAPLPVELISFNATLKDQTSSELTWVTASEINNDHFDIERSDDGTTFKKVGEEAGHGTTNDVNKYSYIDQFGPGILAPVLYYRLKQVDFNGAFVYTDIRKVTLDAKQDGIKVWYDRDITSLSAVITVSESQRITLKIIDVQGKIIADQNLNANKGNNSVRMDMQGLASGVYTFIYYPENGAVQMKKFIKY